jgi:multiple sugar transport system substrate-binding protein
MAIKNIGDAGGGPLVLTGNTWGHPRGYAPLITLNDEHPELFAVSVKWDIRTLQQFADHSFDHLASKYDLIVFDHPFIGEISKQKYLLPLDDLIEPEFLADQKKNSVGKSYESYIWNGSIYALPIDTAGHVSAFRKDLFEKIGEEFPKTWDQVLSLAKKQSSNGGPKVAFPFIPVDIWCLFMTLCANKGFPPFASSTEIVNRSVGTEIINFIIELFHNSPKESKDWNPIKTLDAMSDSDDVLCCPALFGYSNYSMSGFRKHLVNFGTIPSSGNGGIGGILGGAGIGISVNCKHPKTAAQIIKVLASPKIQQTLYASTGGQSGHRSAWISPELNILTHNFYKDTLQDLDDSYLRPRFPGFINIQTQTANIMAEAVYGQKSVNDVLDEVDAIYVKYLELSTK